MLIAIGAHVLSGLGGGQFGRCAMLVGGTDIKDFMTARALESGKHIRRQHRAGQVAEVLDAVDIGERGGDQDAGHLGLSAL